MPCAAVTQTSSDMKFLLALGCLLCTCAVTLRPACAQPPDTAEGPPLLQPIGTLKGHPNALNGVAFSPDGKLAATTTWDKTIRIYDVATQQLLRSLEGHDTHVRSVVFSPDDTKLLSGSWDSTARVWDVLKGEEIRTLRGHDWPVLGLAISPDGTKALTSSDGFRLWDLETGALLRHFTGHTDTVWSVAFSPDGKRALSGSADETMRLWDLETGTEIRSFAGHHNRVLSVRFSPDDGLTALSACTGDGAVRLWDLATGAELRRYTTEEPGISCADFSPDGKRIIAGEGRMNETGRLDHTYPAAAIYLWDTADGRLLGRTKPIPGYISGVAFSPDGKQALTCGYERSAKLWALPE